MSQSKTQLKKIQRELDSSNFGKREIEAAVIPPKDAELMQEPKRSCNLCYGRGTVLHIIADGFKTVEKQIPRLQTGIGEMVKYETVQVRTVNLKRINRPCPCVFRHARFKIRVEAARALLKKRFKIK
jgi:hypothetical protein